MLRIYARRNFPLLRGAAIQLAPHQQALLRHYSDETDSLESQKATLSATNEALRSMLNSLSSSDKSAAAADTSSVMKSTTEKLEAIGAAASAATAFDTLRNTRNTLRDSNDDLRRINSRLDRQQQQSSSPAVERKEAELRQIRQENDGLRKVLSGEVVADAAPKTRSRSSSSETTTTTYQSVWSQPPPPQQRTVHTTDYVIVNNTASSPPPPPRRPRQFSTGFEWSAGEPTESFWFKYRVPLAAVGGFATGLFVGKLWFSSAAHEKQSKAEKARVAHLQREIDAEKREQERLLKEIARKTNT